MKKKKNGNFGGMLGILETLPAREGLQNSPALRSLFLLVVPRSF